MKAWAGRFSKEESSSANAFNASIDFDKRLYREDITGSVAHAKMLGKQGIITPAESEQLVRGLREVLADLESGVAAFNIDAEDVHMNVEFLLTEKIGDTGKKLHTARSRNDQVAVDFRLYVKSEADEITGRLDALMDVLMQIARQHIQTVMPGYTHLQRAQPVTLAYHLSAYQQMFLRDKERLCDCRKRTDVLPLGSGALAGVTYETDRDFLAAELGFAAVSQNGMDAVSDRDFAVEFLSALSIIMMHLSRFCEELILWNSTEFGFIEIDDAYSTGSSIMPQKKNPDLAELIRGKTGRVYGSLVTLLTILKALPLAYNKDMQEDKPPVFDAADTVKACLSIMTEMLPAITFKTQTMREAAQKGLMNATDAADYLVSKGLPFRECHEIIGRIVLHCLAHKKGIEELSLEELQGFSPAFGEDIFGQISVEACINAKKSFGSTSFDNVRKMIENQQLGISK